REHHALVLDAEVVVQMARAVLLHDEFERARGLLLARAAGRLGRDVEAALAVVLGEPAVAAQVVGGARTLRHRLSPAPARRRAAWRPPARRPRTRRGHPSRWAPAATRGWRRRSSRAGAASDAGPACSRGNRRAAAWRPGRCCS